MLKAGAKLKNAKKSNIKTNFLYQVCYQILILALPLITSPYVSRVLGAEGLGIYSYSYSIAYYFVLVSMLGVLNYGNRAIARCREDRDKLNKEFSGIVTLHIIISLICIITYMIYAIFIAKEQLYALLQTAYVLSGLFDITWFYYGIEKFKLTVARNTLIKIVTVALIFAFVRDIDDLWIYCVIMSGSMLISQVMLWMPLKKYISYSFPSKGEICRHLKPMLILFIPTIAISLYKYMDKIMIGILSDKTQLGYYENAESIIRVLTSVIGSLGTVMLPQMANLAANKYMEQFYKYIAVSMRYVMIISFAMSFGLAGIAKVFALVFWGSAFKASGSLIQVLVISVPFISFANVIRTQFLLPQEKDFEYMISVIAGALINLGLNAVLIPEYGAFGAAIATVFAEGTVCIVQAIAVRNDLPICDYIKDAVPFGVLGVFMFVVVYGIRNINSNQIICLLMQLIAGVIIYSIPMVGILYRRKDTVLIAFLHQKVLRGKNADEDS